MRVLDDVLDHPLICEASRPRQQQRRLPADKVEQLVAEYRAGDAMTVLAQRFGVHPMTVTAHLKRAGIDLSRKLLTEPEIDEAVLYSSGWTLERIASPNPRGHRHNHSAQTYCRGVLRRKPWDRG